MSGGEKSGRGKDIGLALSGGGYRATLFHIGSLWRLNELGLLGKIDEITSVSGGSITAAYLGYRWHELSFDDNGVAVNFGEVVVKNLRRFCGKTIDIWVVVFGCLIPFKTSGNVLSWYYRRLFGSATLQDLPHPGKGPRFTIYATNFQTSNSFRFTRLYLADYLLGKINKPKISLSAAVAASSAFSPLIEPLTFKFKRGDWSEWKDAEKEVERWSSFSGEGISGELRTKLRRKTILVDGGYYDNMGLERFMKNDEFRLILVSDAGLKLKIEKCYLRRLSRFVTTARLLSVLSEKTRDLRKRYMYAKFNPDITKWAYWNITYPTAKYDLEDNGLPGPIVRDNEGTKSLGTMRTRLNKFRPEEQERLINWGYALADTALRRYVLDKDAEPGKLPYPDREF